MYNEGIKFVIPSYLENLSLIRALVNTYLNAKLISKKDTMELITVVDELTTNAIEHGYNYEIGDIFIYISKNKNQIKIAVDDFGVGFNKFKKSKSEGNMGLNIVRAFVDDFKIKPKEIGTRFEIVKDIKEEISNELKF